MGRRMDMAPEPEILPSQDEDRPKCKWCGSPKVTVVDEQPHPLFGILGMTLQTLRCDDKDCAKLTVV